VHPRAIFLQFRHVRLSSCLMAMYSWTHDGLFGFAPHRGRMPHHTLAALCRFMAMALVYHLTPPPAANAATSVVYCFFFTKMAAISVMQRGHRE
jgi:hypothetical protein